MQMVWWHSTPFHFSAHPFSGSWWPVSKFRDRIVPGLKPDSTAAHVSLADAISSAVGQTSSCWCSAEACRGGGQIRCCPRHLNAVQNHLPK
ncbi:hypothetical protein AVEN_92487-1 [Araneus ventricosus]|uniref:Uncharacterized protein n=1 Tax=Araneus ventricosus TaxID=182803 RepID=A0A4Y2AJ11_ARAVE|nr:hypothetical protein AVEN_92487-1 [Araneus ventricosus]